MCITTFIGSMKTTRTMFPDTCPSPYTDKSLMVRQTATGTYVDRVRTSKYRTIYESIVSNIKVGKITADSCEFRLEWIGSPTQLIANITRMFYMAEPIIPPETTTPTFPVNRFPTPTPTTIYDLEPNSYYSVTWTTVYSSGKMYTSPVVRNFYTHGPPSILNTSSSQIEFAEAATNAREHVTYTMRLTSMSDTPPLVPDIVRTNITSSPIDFSGILPGTYVGTLTSVYNNSAEQYSTTPFTITI
jgi:hypothetical protein